MLCTTKNFSIFCHLKSDWSKKKCKHEPNDLSNKLIKLKVGKSRKKVCKTTTSG